MPEKYDINSEQEKIRRACKDPDSDAMKIYYVLRTLPLSLRTDLQCIINKTDLITPFDNYSSIDNEDID